MKLSWPECWWAEPSSEHCIFYNLECWGSRLEVTLGAINTHHTDTDGRLVQPSSDRDWPQTGTLRPRPPQHSHTKETDSDYPQPRYSHLQQEKYWEFMCFLLTFTLIEIVAGHFNLMNISNCCLSLLQLWWQPSVSRPPYSRLQNVISLMSELKVLSSFSSPCHNWPVQNYNLHYPATRLWILPRSYVYI